jgi:DNA-binding transcriptional MerR regulator
MKAQDARALGYRTTGEVAESLGTTPRTVLHYEEMDLVTPKMSDGGTRFYSDFDVRRLEVCLLLSRLGVPLRVLTGLSTTRPASRSGRESSHKLVPQLDELREFLAAKLTAIDGMLDDLDLAREHIVACWECPNRPTRSTCPDCPCETELSSSALLHLTWDFDRGADPAED